MITEYAARLRATRKFLGLDSQAIRGLHLLTSHYLSEEGWLRSYVEQSCVNNDDPIPWYTYPAIHALADLVDKNTKVFEYGCGNSSLWWAKKAGAVVSVEHDREWFEQVRDQTQQAVRLLEADSTENGQHFAQLEPFFALDLPRRHDHLDAEHDLARGSINEPFRAYAAEILNYPAGHFNVIVVDGMARVLTAWLAMDRLADDGLIVFDNSNWTVFDDAYRMLLEAGFARLDFWGPGPINHQGWCTSIFTRSLKAFQRPVRGTLS